MVSQFTPFYRSLTRCLLPAGMAQNVYLDDWAILGVPPGSDQDAIRKAYRKQALLHHPDKGGDARLWALRPISLEMRRYAALDVWLLLRIHQAMTEDQALDEAWRARVVAASAQRETEYRALAEPADPEDLADAGADAFELAVGAAFKWDRGAPQWAAAFLASFVEETPWVHLDIAGTAWTTKTGPYQKRGATGVGVRLLVEALQTWKESRIV